MHLSFFLSSVLTSPVPNNRSCASVSLLSVVYTGCTSTHKRAFAQGKEVVVWEKEGQRRFSCSEEREKETDARSVANRKTHIEREREKP
jgi:hypothetical protein